MTEYEKLQDLISEIDFLVDHGVTSKTPGFLAWQAKAERFLIKRYGEDSFEHQKFKSTEFRPGLYTSKQELTFVCKRGLLATKLLFESYLTEINETAINAPQEDTPINCGKVFIVHGRDGELKHAVARLVEKQGVEAIILSEQANKGKTIIEKFEENSDVSGAICLFTADDLGRAKTDTEERPRARQNVVFEAGYFMGKLGRDRVVIIAEKGVELPSDMQGIVYTSKDNWQLDVLKELKAMGYNVDFNKLF